LRCYTRAISKDPDYVKTYLNMAKIVFTRLHPSAKRCFLKTIDLDPKHKEAHHSDKHSLQKILQRGSKNFKKWKELSSE
jgi:hypothetical protein